jgi:hypothetical protein
MNYELAKQLKDAGFPQQENSYQAIQTYPAKNAGVIPYYPSLSELIEACGDRFNSVCREPDGMWWADWESKPLELEGDRATTPEEAVARLWLALNKS